VPVRKSLFKIIYFQSLFRALEVFLFNKLDFFHFSKKSLEVVTVIGNVKNNKEDINRNSSVAYLFLTFADL
jgi:hypothetical protein